MQSVRKPQMTFTPKGGIYHVSSAVGTVTSYGLEDRMIGVRVPLGTFHIVQTFSGDHLASLQWVPGLLHRRGGDVKRQERESDHSPPTSAEVKKTRVYKSTPPRSS
jgi:hypothetical protein